MNSSGDSYIPPTKFTQVSEETIENAINKVKSINSGAAKILLYEPCFWSSIILYSNYGKIFKGYYAVPVCILPVIREFMREYLNSTEELRAEYRRIFEENGKIHVSILTNGDIEDIVYYKELIDKKSLDVTMIFIDEISFIVSQYFGYYNLQSYIVPLELNIPFFNVETGLVSFFMRTSFVDCLLYNGSKCFSKIMKYLRTNGGQIKSNFYLYGKMLEKCEKSVFNSIKTHWSNIYIFDRSSDCLPLFLLPKSFLPTLAFFHDIYGVRASIPIDDRPLIFDFSGELPPYKSEELKKFRYDKRYEEKLESPCPSNAPEYWKIIKLFNNVLKSFREKGNGGFHGDLYDLYNKKFSKSSMEIFIKNAECYGLDQLMTVLLLALFSGCSQKIKILEDYVKERYKYDNGDETANASIGMFFYYQLKDKLSSTIESMKGFREDFCKRTTKYPENAFGEFEFDFLPASVKIFYNSLRGEKIDLKGLYSEEITRNNDKLKGSNLFIFAGGVSYGELALFDCIRREYGCHVDILCTDIYGPKFISNILTSSDTYKDIYRLGIV